MLKYIIGALIILAIFGLFIYIIIKSQSDSFASEKDIARSKFQYFHYPYYSAYGINGCMNRTFNRFTKCINSGDFDLSLCKKKLDNQLALCRQIPVSETKLY